MGEVVPLGGGSPFDALKRMDERGEFWWAREVAEPLGYTWRGFTDAIERGQTALRVNGQDPDLHIGPRKAPSVDALGRPRSQQDYRMTREGVYATIQGGDPRKPEIAEAWAYFRAKTREAEAAARAPRTYLEALEAAARVERDRLALATRVAELAPKAAERDAFIAPEGWIPNREAAKMLYGATGKGPSLLLWKLEELGVLYRSSEGCLLPKQDPWVVRTWLRSHRLVANGRLVSEVQYSPTGLVSVYRRLHVAGEPVRDPRESAA